MKRDADKGIVQLHQVEGVMNIYSYIIHICDGTKQCSVDELLFSMSAITYDSCSRISHAIW